MMPTPKVIMAQESNRLKRRLRQRAPYFDDLDLGIFVSRLGA